jgi:hypothetical protein
MSQICDIFASEDECLEGAACGFTCRDVWDVLAEPVPPRGDGSLLAPDMRRHMGDGTALSRRDQREQRKLYRVGDVDGSRAVRFAEALRETDELLRQ